MLLGFLLSITLGSVHAAPPPQAAGLILQFKPGTSEEIRDRLHKDVGAKLEYRGTARPMEVVHLEPSSRDVDRKELRAACKRYLESESVVGCELNERLKADNAAAGAPVPCPSPAAPPSPLAELSRRIRQDAGCNPFADASTLKQGDQDWPEQYQDSAPADSKLPPFWNRQMTGSDLVSGALDDWDRRHPAKKTQPSEVGILDAGFDLREVPESSATSEVKACRQQGNPASCACCVVARDLLPGGDGTHGTSVMNLIAGDPPAGGGSRPKIRYASTTLTSADLGIAVDRMTAHPPKVVNMSMHFPWVNGVDQRDRLGDVRPSASAETRRGIDVTREGLRQLGEKTLMVYASGNEYPAPVDYRRAGLPGIFVGSCAPNGLMSDFSSDGPDLTICAPSDRSALRVHGAPGGLQPFGGTSGAAPQVTGALANVTSLLPELNLAEAKRLLTATAIHPAGYRPANGRNGAGALNEYKMIAVSMRLKEAGWPSAKAHALLDSGAAFDFAADSRARIAKALPLLRSDDCAKYKQGVKLLREAYFLSPDDPAIRAALAARYEEFGYKASALYVGNAPVREVLASIRSPEMRAMMSIRAGLPAQEVAPAIFNTPDSELRRSLIRYALGAYRDGAWGLLRLAIQREDGARLKDTIGHATREMNEEDALALFLHIYDDDRRDPGSNVWQDAARKRLSPDDQAYLLMEAEQRLTAEDWEKVAERAMTSPYHQVREMIAMRAVFALSREKCLSFMRRLRGDAVASVREAADPSRCPAP